MKHSNAELKIHYHPEKGWLNDPNGLSYFGDEYHIFYQHLPDREYPDGSSMHWGHAVTKNFIDYTELTPALYPDKDYDRGGVWSGTAICKDDTLYLFYASVSAEGRQTISVAYTKDGRTFEKYDGNPIIAEYPEDGSNDFRDPALICIDGKYYLVVASADKKKNTGNMLLYSSDDILNWNYEGVLKEYEDCRFCECPSFVKHGDGYILSVSVCPNNAPHYFEVMYGSFDGKKFEAEIVSHFQKGPDEYAGQIFSAPDDRNILITWIPGWDYQPKDKCIGCLSLPLEITVHDGIISAYPVKEVRHLINADDTVTDAYIKEEYVRKGEEVIITIDK